jgi:transposase
MSNKPRKMIKVKEVLQCLINGKSISGISKSCKITRNTVKEYRSKVHQAGYSLEQAIALNENELERIIYKKRSGSEVCDEFKSQEDYYVSELDKSHVTIQLLYEEYFEQGGKMGRSTFYEQMGLIGRKNEVTYTKTRNPGEVMEVDYAGKKLRIITHDGEEVECEMLVCVLPYSNLIYCEAQLNQRQESYINGLGRALLYIGKKPKTIISDNLKSGVKKADKYEAELTELAQEASEYYKLQINATRVAKPRDKANVERSVRIIYQRIYAKLRDRQITGIEELNKMIWVELEELNTRKINQKPSRKEIYEEYEQTHMLPLDVTQLMEIKKSRTCKVGKNYHVELTEDHTYYSIPSDYTGEEVKMKYSESEVEIFYKGERIALHSRCKVPGKYTTVEGHMPANHRIAKKVSGYTKEDILRMASKVGVNTSELVDKMMERNPYVQQGFKSALGVISLEKKYGREVLENACKELKDLKCTYQSVRAYLEKGMSRLKIIRGDQSEEQPINHENIRHIKANQ